MSDTPALASSFAARLAVRPAALAAACLIAGIFLHGCVAGHPLGWVVVTAVAAGGALGCDLWRGGWARGRARVSRGLLVVALFAAGVGLAELAAHYYPADHIGGLAAEEPRLAQVELRIDQPPRVLRGAFGKEDLTGRRLVSGDQGRTLTLPSPGVPGEGKIGGGPAEPKSPVLEGKPTGRPIAPRQVCTASVLAVRTWDGWEHASGRVLVQMDEPHSQLAVGQRVRVLGWIGRPAGAMNPGEFDWASYYRRQRTLASVRVRRAGNVQILESPSTPLLDRLRQSVRGALGRGFAQEQALDAALLRALLVGDSDPQLRDVQQQFVRTGTSHHLAISGMHIAILGGFVYLVFRVVRCSPRFATWVGTGFVIVYGVVALPSPPVVRSVLLCVGLAMGILGRRAIDGVQVLSLSVLAMLVYDPLDLSSPGFQLSFGTVLGLMLMTRPMLRIVESWRDPHQRVADSFRPPRGLRAVRRWAREHLTQVLVAGVVAWLVSMPLIAYHFGQLNPWSIPASIAMGVPAVFGLVLGLMKVLLTFVLPMFAGTWAAVAAVPMVVMRQMVDGLARLPGSDVALGPVPLWAILVYYGLLGMPLVGAVVGRLSKAEDGAPRSRDAKGETPRRGEKRSGLLSPLLNAVGIFRAFRFGGTHVVIGKEPSPCPLAGSRLFRSLLPEYRERGREERAPAEPKDPVGVSATWRSSLLAFARSSRVLLVGPILAACLGVSLPLVAMVVHRADGNSVRVTVLSVGAGSCAVVELANGRTVLIDCGSATISDLHGRCLEPFFRERRIGRIDSVYLTHANTDHFSAAGQVVEAGQVASVYVDPLFLSSEQSSSARALVSELGRRRVGVRALSRGERIGLGPGTHMDVLWPAAEERIAENDASLVLRLEHRGQSVLFTGDIEALAQRRLLLESPEALAADVLIAPHHGSAESTTADFIRAVRPGAIVSSNDRTLTSKQLLFDRIARRLPVYRTHACGAVTIMLGKEEGPVITPFVAADGRRAVR